MATGGADTRRRASNVTNSRSISAREAREMCLANRSDPVLVRLRPTLAWGTKDGRLDAPRVPLAALPYPYE